MHSLGKGMRKKSGFFKPTISSRMKVVKTEVNTCNNASYSETPVQCIEQIFKEEMGDVVDGNPSEVMEEKQERIHQIMTQSFKQQEDTALEQECQERLEEKKEEEEVRKSPQPRRLYRTLSSQKKLQMPPLSILPDNSFHSLVRYQESFDSILKNETCHNSSQATRRDQQKPEFDLSLKATSENKSELYIKKKELLQKYRMQNIHKMASQDTKPIYMTRKSKSAAAKKPLADKDEADKENEKVVPNHFSKNNSDKVERDGRMRREDDGSSEWSEASCLKEVVKKAPNYRISNRKPANDPHKEVAPCRIEKTRLEFFEKKSEVCKNVPKESVKSSELVIEDGAKSVPKKKDDLKVKVSDSVSDVDDASNKENVQKRSLMHTSKQDYAEKSTIAESRKTLSDSPELKVENPEVVNKELNDKVENAESKDHTDKNSSGKTKKKDFRKIDDQEKIISEKIENIEKWLDNSMHDYENSENVEESDRAVSESNHPNKFEKDDNPIAEKSHPKPPKDNESHSKPAKDKDSIPKPAKDRDSIPKPANDKESHSKPVNDKKCNPKPSNVIKPPNFHDKDKNEKVQKSNPDKSEDIQESSRNENNQCSGKKKEAHEPIQLSSTSFEDVDSKSRVFTITNAKMKETPRKDESHHNSKESKPSKNEKDMVKRVVQKVVEKVIAKPISSSSSSKSCSEDESENTCSSDSKGNATIKSQNLKANGFFSFNANRLFKPANFTADGLNHKALKFSEITNGRPEKSLKVKRSYKGTSQDTDSKHTDTQSEASSLNNYFPDKPKSRLTKQAPQLSINIHRTNSILSTKTKSIGEMYSSMVNQDPKSAMKITKPSASIYSIQSVDDRSIKFNTLDKNNNRRNDSEKTSFDDGTSEDDASDEKLMTMIKKLRKGTMTPRSSLKCLGKLFESKQNNQVYHQQQQKPHHQQQQQQYQQQQYQQQPQQQSDRIKFKETNVDDNFTRNNISVKIRENMQKLKPQNRAESSAESPNPNPNPNLTPIIPNNPEHHTVLEANPGVYSNSFMDDQYSPSTYEPLLCPYDASQNPQQQQQPLQHSQQQPLQHSQQQPLQHSQQQHSQAPIQQPLQPQPLQPQQQQQQPPSHHQQQPQPPPPQQQQQQQHDSLCCWTLQPLSVKLIQEPGMTPHYTEPMNLSNQYEEYAPIEQNNLLFTEPLMEQQINNRPYIPGKVFEDWNVVPPCQEERRWEQGWFEKENLAPINNNNSFSYPLSMNQSLQIMPDYGSGVYNMDTNLAQNYQMGFGFPEETSMSEFRPKPQDQNSNIPCDFNETSEAVSIRKEREQRITFSSLSRCDNSLHTLPHKGNSQYSYDLSLADSGDKSRSRASFRPSLTSNRIRQKIQFSDKNESPSFAFGDHKDSKPIQKTVSSVLTKCPPQPSNSYLSISTIKTTDSQQDTFKNMGDELSIRVERRILRRV